MMRDDSRLGGDIHRVRLVLQHLAEHDVRVFYYFEDEEMQLTGGAKSERSTKTGPTTQKGETGRVIDSNPRQRHGTPIVRRDEARCSVPGSCANQGCQHLGLRRERRIFFTSRKVASICLPSRFLVSQSSVSRRVSPIATRSARVSCSGLVSSTKAIECELSLEPPPADLAQRTNVRSVC